MARGHRRSRLAAALIIAASALAACGGRFHVTPDAGRASSTAPAVTNTGGAGAATAAGGSPTDTGAGMTRQAVAPAARASSPPTALPPSTTVPTVSSPHEAIAGAYQAYLTDLSGLDDTLSKAYLAPLASVTTTRLGQASVRQAAAILSAQEHGVGTLRDAHLEIRMTGPASAALADCQDQEDFHLVSDGSGTPDPFVQRGYFVGSAQLLLEGGRWLVDTFTTTRVPCSF